MIRALVGLSFALAAPLAAQQSVVDRGADGSTTVTATRIDGLDIDGVLDEAIYTSVPAMTGLIQQLPNEGDPASERTEMWVLYDDENIYVTARAHESVPESEWHANEMRHDVIQLRQNDSFSVMLDTFHDRRNGVAFLVTPIGGYSDFAITNEGNVNTDWNVVWDYRTGRFEGGWTVEIAIPFKSLRYRPGTDQTWGIQLRRIIRRRTESSYLTALPISAAPGNSLIAGLWRISGAATLEGLEVPPPSLNAEIKPYAISGLRTDRTLAQPVDNELSADAGLDLKYNITPNLTADVTINTDFAQVEVDERQINLTRFSLFFPEKREFFLEGRGNFDFGPRLPGVPRLFFSRRIGLQSGQVVPIRAGGRITGKVGDFDIGLLNAQTGDEAVSGATATNYSVVRIKRDVLRRSSVGGIFTNRSNSLFGAGSSQAYGFDTRIAPHDDVIVDAYWAGTDTPGATGSQVSYASRLFWNADRYGVGLGHTLVGDDFRPEVGFVSRGNFEQSLASFRFSPRPASIDWVRRFIVQGQVDRTTTVDTGLLETRTVQGLFQIELENSDLFRVHGWDGEDVLFQPFTISPGVTLNPGRYDFRNLQVMYAFGAQRPVSGSVSVTTGWFWSGESTTVGLGAGRVEISNQLSIEPTASFTWVDLPEGSFDTKLIRTRLTYTLSPRAFLSGLVQYSSAGDSFSTNLRFRWRYSPGSELFIVWTEDLDTDPLMPNRRTELRNRGLVIKATRLLRL